MWGKKLFGGIRAPTEGHKKGKEGISNMMMEIFISGDGLPGFAMRSNRSFRDMATLWGMNLCGGGFTLQLDNDPKQT